MLGCSKIEKRVVFEGVVKDVEIYRGERAGIIAGTSKPARTIIYGDKGEIVTLATDSIEGLRLGVFGQIIQYKDVWSTFPNSLFVFRELEEE